MEGTENAVTAVTQPAIPTTDIVVPEEHASLVDDMAIDSDDLLLGKVLVQQALSKRVQEETASMGEIIDSLTGRKLASRSKGHVEVILFQPFKTWVRLKDGNEFLEQVPVTPENASWPWEVEDEQHGKILNQKTLNYYCLLTSEIKAGEYFPRLIQFKSTAYKVGKKVESRRAFLAKFKKPLAFKKWKLSVTQEKNEKGTWFLPVMEENGDTSKEERDAVANWAEVIKTANVTVDDSDLTDIKGPGNDHPEPDVTAGEGERDF